MSRWRIYPLVFAFIGFVCSLTVDASSWKQGTRRHNLLSVITTTTTQPPAPLYPVFESATMTSWNTPSPVEVSCDIYTAGREGWRASDKNYATYWDAEVYNTAPYPHYWQYFLGAGVSNVLVSATITPYQSVAPIVFDVEGSQNGTGWTVLFTNGVADNNLPQMFTNLFPAYYSYYRFNFSNGVSGNRCVIREIHLSSARPLPVLTSNTEPSPYVASADMEYATNYCFHAFDGNVEGVQWRSYPSTTTNYCQLDCGSNVYVGGCSVFNVSGLGMKHFRLRGSANGTTWVVMLETNLANAVYEQRCTATNTLQAFRYYQFYSTNTYTAGNCQVFEFRPWRYESQ